ncbi:MAG TPA: carboxypeptidase-like regulatory domain-containing protein [Gemmatimonadaceae bacterium]
MWTMAQRAWRSVVAMLIGVLLFPVAARAQTRRDAVLVARVIDIETGNPLEGVELRLVELGRVARSNRQGIVHFTKIPPGSYNLFARRLGIARR